ncbi:MAG: tripartite tricarboxylate transporter substrate binding protein [Betaproteobacteria bacterium]|nr:tripartite tricarboxylate transporter substrate binding protein [Betaproteobacteria bacterium]
MNPSKALSLCVAVAAGSTFSFSAFAQAYPGKPIKVIVAVAPGPGVDYVARALGPRMIEDLGQPLVFENQAGGNGIIGSSAVARAVPDGYTLLMATPSMIITAMMLTKGIPYDSLKDFAPVTAAVEPYTSLIVNPSVPANNVRELVEWVKKNPGKVSYASSGIGSVFHMVGELFNQAAGTDILHVPYKSVPPAVQAVVANEVPMTYAAVSNALPQVRGGKVRMIGILEKNRFPRMADVPTVGEALAGFEKPPSWFGYLAPAGTPPAVLSRIQGSVVKAMATPEVRKSFDDLALGIIGNTPAEFAAQIKSGFAVYASAIKIAGLKPE